MSTLLKDVANIAEAARENGRQEGRAEILARVRTLPSPWHTDPMSWHGESFVCDWCNVHWAVEKFPGAEPDDYLRQAVHPANGCLFADAHAAQETP